MNNDLSQDEKIDSARSATGAVLLGEQPLNTDGVIKNLAKYFMTFLETDFKKRRLPKRNTNQFVAKGNRVGYEMARYETLNKLILKNFGKTNDELKVTVKQGQYVSSMSHTLLAFIAERIDDVDAELIGKLNSAVIKAYGIAKSEHLDNYEEFLLELKDIVRSLIEKTLVAPLIEDVLKPLLKAEVSLESGLHRLQSEVIDHLYSLLDESLEAFAPRYYSSKEPKAVLDEATIDCREVITVDGVRDLLKKDFDEFATHDCYKDLYQLSRSLQLLDKTELYLYLFDLNINLEGRDSFPLFYVPVNLEHNEDDYTLTFDNRVFVNTKAFEYVCQEYAAKLQTSVTPDKFDRILYAEADSSLREKLEHILRRVVQTLYLDEELDLNTSSLKVSSNASITLSNTVSLFVFDKSDEALINDYEEILNDEGEISTLFAELLQSFLSKNPVRFDDDVDRNWDDMDIPEKLLTESPIPLNEEQKKVVMALEKDDCKVLILEGPPGTGKSHTITSVICKAVLEGKSVLVLSDKKEALDVVEDKIASTLNKVRVDESFQNPILRLGAMGKGIGKVVDGTVLGAIKHHYSTYRKDETAIDSQYQELTRQTKEELDENTSYFAGLSMADLKAHFDLAENYEQYGALFDGFEKPINRERITQILESLKQLRDVEIEHEGFLKLASAYPGEASIEELQENYGQFMRALHATDKSVVRAVEELALSGSMSFASLQELLDLSKKVIEASGTDLGGVILALEDDQKFDDLSYQLEFTQGVIQAGERIFEYLAPAKNRNLAQIYVAVANDIATKPKAKLTELADYIAAMQGLKSSIIGFAGKRGRIDELTLSLRKAIPSFQLSNPEKSLSDLIALKATLEFAASLVAESFSDDDAVLSHAVIYCGYLATDVRHADAAHSIANDVTELARRSEDANHAFDAVQLRSGGEIESAIAVLNRRHDLLADAMNYESFLGMLETDITESSSLTVEMLDSALGEYNELDAEALETAADDLKVISALYGPERKLLERLELSQGLSNIAECKNTILDLTKAQRGELYEYLDKQDELIQLFDEVPNDSYLEEQSAIEHYNTAKMAYMLDKQILEYTTSKAAELQTLRGLLKKKQKFPQSLFSNLKQAFPCILAGIRDYAEYIPLEKDLFDLIIIDEASQVSIAQALPAFIRGKKILILGDDKQFSNVKAGNASIERNQYFRHELIDVFKKDNVGITDLAVFEHKIRENFDVKRSVLDFSRFISNYVIQLKKHFRCYPEIISYSNEQFYRGTLQCVKLRTVPITEVIKFDILEHDGRIEKYAKTNTPEAEFILATLQSWHDKQEKKSIGIITPHTEQARIISETLQASDIWSWLEKECSIKIMTFDTCQGEERDYIFYSMVASPVADRLSHIFGANFDGTQDYEQHLNAQRMNVGFSRAKNAIHFVLSKPIAEFRGEIQKALKHYENQLNTARDIHLGGTDEKSPMEKKVQEWLYMTKFYQENTELEITPQFPIGQYLKYIDQNYSHPGYVVDFLLVLGKNTIILEYDGFKEHFESLDEVDATNYQSYQKPEDYYRRKVLESYGYRFIRVNKFNLGKDPVDSLNEMLTEKFKKKSSRLPSLTS